MLSGVELADFSFLIATLGLTKGNLSAHMDRLEREGYVRVEKRFEGKVSRTEYRLTRMGKQALDAYWQEIESIRTLARTGSAKVR